MRLLSMLTMILLAGQAHAVTWHFDEDGNSQGWYAQDATGLSSQQELLRSETRDGFWRISTTTSGARLVSPELHFDSALFDRIEIRFRVVHTRPFEGGLSFYWTNSTNRDYPGREPLTFQPDSGGTGTF